MSEFWQAYGNWILFAVFFLLMIGHHLFMGHGSHGVARGAGARGRQGAAGGAGDHGCHGTGSGGHGHAPEDAQDPGTDVPRPRRRSGGCH